MREPRAGGSSRAVRKRGFGFLEDRFDEPLAHFLPERMGSWLIGTAVGPDEDEISVRATFDLPTGIMDEAVVISAQGDEVVEVGWTSVGPVDQVMSVDPAGALAAGEPTSLIPLADLTVEPGRNGPTYAADPDRAVPSIEDGLEAGVASETAGGLTCDRGSVLDLGDSPNGYERFEIHMNDDTGAIRIGI